MTAQHEQIINFLKDLDAEISFKDKSHLYLIGGSAITLAYDPGNRTADLDFIDPPDILLQKGGPASGLANKYHVYISAVPEINFSVPEDWRIKCRPIKFGLKNLEVFIPCIEDILLGKMARLEPKDFEDILGLHEKKLLDHKKLLHRLRQNKKELREISYRNNAKLLFREIFGRDLVFVKGDIKVGHKI